MVQSEDKMTKASRWGQGLITHGSREGLEAPKKDDKPRYERVIYFCDQTEESGSNGYRRSKKNAIRITLSMSTPWLRDTKRR